VRFDLQSHSTCSDGELEPADVVGRAAMAGVELLALTDHDTVEGVAEARAAADEHRIALVPAVEISALDDTGADLHILGYRVDTGDARLLDVLRLAREDRFSRADRMAGRLRELGFELDPAPLERRRAAGHALGRPHLAVAVIAHPANAERLAAEGCTDTSAFFEAYLVPGRPAFTPRHAPTIHGAIDLIHDAGGVAVWAHPFWDIEQTRDVLERLERFAASGLDGVEAFYATHTREQTHVLYDRARALRLLTTGSADFHGPSHERLSRFLAFETYGLEPALGPIAASR
jgi:predicted metal-dependent phosphoesterase TrpH